MLHVLGFFMHLIPSQVERFHQEQLNQPMSPQHAQRQCIARSGQLRPTVRRVLHQIALAQRLQHARHSARRNRQGIGQFAGRRWLAPLRGADLVDRLYVIFDREAGHCELLRFVS